MQDLVPVPLSPLLHSTFAGWALSELTQAKLLQTSVPATHFIFFWNFLPLGLQPVVSVLLTDLQPNFTSSGKHS